MTNANGILFWPIEIEGTALFESPCGAWVTCWSVVQEGWASSLTRVQLTLPPGMGEG
jgi:hypothetical protein